MVRSQGHVTVLCQFINYAACMKGKKKQTVINTNRNGDIHRSKQIGDLYYIVLTAHINYVTGSG